MAFDFTSLQQVPDSGAKPLRFIRKLGGATQSLLVSDEGNELWVVKMQDQANPTNHIVNEVLGSHICGALGIPTPETKALTISSHFFEDQGTWLSTLKDPKQRTSGLHFASRYLPQLFGQEMMNTIPSTLVPCIINANDCLGMFILDVWAKHGDTRQVLYERSDLGLRAIFIDNGEMFGGSRWDLSKSRVITSTINRAVIFIRNRAELIHQWIYQMREQIPAAMTFAVSHLPNCWLFSDAEALTDRFIGRLDALPRQVSLAIVELERQLALSPTFTSDRSRKRMVTVLDPVGDKHHYYID